MGPQKIEGLLGMAQRAGKLASGEGAVLRAIASGQAAAVIVASDASGRAREELMLAAGGKGIPVHSAFTKEMLGRCLGKEYRAAAALLDKGFAKALDERMRG